jgi:regulatory protein
MREQVPRMPTITKISTTKRQPNRPSVYVDGRFAFACSLNVVARFHLREGMSLSAEKLTEIAQGEIRQKCLDRAMRYLQTRLHSRAELQRKLRKAQFSLPLIEQALGDLAKLGYVDDEQFARARVALAAERKHHGKRRATDDLLQRGVSQQVAEQTVGQTYGSGGELMAATKLAEKHAARLRRLDPIVARRRLAGLLSRRGFDYEQVAGVVETVLGPQRDAVAGRTYRT